jgi:two-component system response regulator AtoC
MKRTILVVEDEQNMAAIMSMVLGDAGYEVLSAASGEEGLPHLTNPDLDVVVTDLRMPGMGGDQFIVECRRERPDVPVVVVTAYGSIRSAVQSIQAGACDYLTKPFEPEELQIVVHNALKLRDVLSENVQLHAVVANAVPHHRLLGESPAMQALHEEITRIAPYKTNLLITGESGTGKELVARTIHDLGPRAQSPMVTLNCVAIPQELMESELFGYVKGAFTGATQNRMGRLEQAKGGSLFLDEIGDLDLALQGKLLRVLQEREFSPVGSDLVRHADVRFMAATHRDLWELVEQGQFREDLLYRLDVYRVNVPPLRDRREDIPLLARTFMRDLGAEIGKPVTDFTDEAMAVLNGYPWPGNVRELRNAVERSLLSCQADTITVDDLPAKVRQSNVAVATPSSGPGDADLDAWLQDNERQAIIDALIATEGVQVQAAKRLGISERSLWHRIKKLNIEIDRVIRP